MKTLSQVKEANHQGPHIVWFHVYEMPRVGKYIETKTHRKYISGYRWLRGMGGLESGSYGVFFWGQWECSKVVYDNGWKTRNIAKAIELFTLNGCIV